MQTFELLGGKYQQGEQILPGAIQSFRGYELPTGRPVFIHRIPSKEAAAQEIAGLLSAGLIRSAVVRKTVLDVYEKEPYRFLVTEPDRQCVPLRDWLERETGGLTEPVVSAPAAETAPHPLALEAAVAEPVEEETRISPEVEATEFARMFRAALAGKMERVRRDAQRDDVVTGYRPTGEPALEEEVEEENPTVPPVASAPKVPASEPATPGPSKADPQVAGASNLAPSPPSEPELFSRLREKQKTGRSNLIVFLAVLGVLVVLLVMFVVVFVKR